MEHIDGRIIRHDLLHIGKGIEEKVKKLLRCHIVILDFSGTALVVHIVGRVGDDEVCLAAVHKGGVGFLFCAVTADESVPPQRPDVTEFREGRLLQLGIHIKIILFGFNAIVKELRQLLFVKAGEERVKVRRLQRLNLHTQKLFVPSGIHRHAVVGNDVGFLLGFRKVVGKNAIVTVDDDRIDKTELTERGAEFVDLLRRMGTGVIDIGNQLRDRYELHLGRCFH